MSGPMVAESKVVRVAMAGAILGISALLLREPQPLRRQLLDAKERAAARQLTAEFRELTHNRRCPRPPLREPAVRGGPDQLLTIYARWADVTSPQSKCLLALGAIKPGVTAIPPEHAYGCALVDAELEQLRHVDEACSPQTPEAFDHYRLFPDGGLHSLAQIRAAQLCAAGELGAAATRLTDTIRLLDDHGRGGTLVAGVIGWAYSVKTADVLGELLVDPRLRSEDARAIAHDLDVLLATAPDPREMMAFEGEWIARQPAGEFITNDAEQDQALLVLAHRRFLDTLDELCRDVELRTCVERLRARGPERPFDLDELRRFGAAPFDARDMRDRIIERLSTQTLSHWPMYLARAGGRVFALTALRMQAELRLMTPAECRDPQRRRARLERFLVEGIVLGNDADLVVMPPAWINEARHEPLAPRALRCAP